MQTAATKIVPKELHFLNSRIGWAMFKNKDAGQTVKKEEAVSVSTFIKIFLEVTLLFIYDFRFAATNDKDKFLKKVKATFTELYDFYVDYFYFVFKKIFKNF